MARAEVKTVFDQKLFVTPNDLRLAKDEIIRGNQRAQMGDEKGANKNYAKAAEIVGQDLYAALASGETASIKFEQFTTKEGYVGVNVTASASTTSKLPKSFIDDPRRTHALTHKGQTGGTQIADIKSQKDAIKAATVVTKEQGKSFFGRFFERVTRTQNFFELERQRDLARQKLKDDEDRQIIPVVDSIRSNTSGGSDGYLSPREIKMAKSEANRQHEENTAKLNTVHEGLTTKTSGNRDFFSFFKHQTIDITLEDKEGPPPWKIVED